jgi:peptidoglycan/LPS O-acetylase OafA/YrhL
VSKITYRPEIDGLRAIAVSAVIAFHAGFDSFAGGFIGVDVFFVISGYLITSLIIADCERGQFSFADFYERRARRILPALLVVMAVTIPGAWALLSPHDFARFSESVAAVPLFSSNILFWKESGYFDIDSQLKPLIHTWSLGVEEQFYLFFPPLLLVLYAFGRGRPVLVTGLTLIASFAAAVTLVHVKPSAAFFLLPTRAWELLSGSMVALTYGSTWDPARHSRVRDVLAVAGLGAILVSVFVFDKDTLFPGWSALLPVAGTVLVIACSRSANGVGRLLSSRAMVGLGLVSYSAYLWHQPLFAFAHYSGVSPSDVQVFALLVAATLALSIASYHWVERPFRDRSRFSRRTIFSIAATASALLVAMGIFGAETKGFELFYVNHRLNQADRELYMQIAHDTGGDLYPLMVDDGHCRFWSRTPDPAFEQRFARCAETMGSAVVVLGDSHGMNIFNVLAKSEVFPFVVGIAQGYCRPQNDHAFCQYHAFEKFAAHYKSKIRTVFFHQSGSYLMQDREGHVNTNALFKPGAPFRLSQPAADAAIQYLKRLEASVDVVWLGPFPEARVDFHRFGAIKNNFKIPPATLRRFKELDAALANYVARSGQDLRYVSLNDVLAITPDFLRFGQCVTYLDDNHLSSCGETVLAERLRSAFESGPLRAFNGRGGAMGGHDYAHSNQGGHPEP